MADYSLEVFVALADLGLIKADPVALNVSKALLRATQSQAPAPQSPAAPVHRVRCLRPSYGPPPLRTGRRLSLDQLAPPQPLPAPPSPAEGGLVDANGVVYIKIPGVGIRPQSTFGLEASDTGPSGVPSTQWSPAGPRQAHITGGGPPITSPEGQGLFRRAGYGPPGPPTFRPAG